MVRLTVRGGGGSAPSPSALTVSKCENFDPFFSLKFDSFILNKTISDGGITVDFLAVQDSSIGDLVSESVTQSSFDFSDF